MPVSQSDLEQLLDSLKRDVAATIGLEHQGDVDDFASNGREFITDHAWFTQWIVDEVQQHFHDTFLDTTWPACPRHGNHPLWFKDGSWWCDRDGLAVAKLGDLATIVKAG